MQHVGITRPIGGTRLVEPLNPLRIGPLPYAKLAPCVLIAWNGQYYMTNMEYGEV